MSHQHMHDNIHAAQTFVDRIDHRGAAFGRRQVSSNKQRIWQVGGAGAGGCQYLRAFLAKEGHRGRANPFAAPR
ncbi:hypothetical protein HSBAA_44980 [Vreelandella sulfidaeris]|uniref:Uncharacterized protein n=1 Tax=Vreelandella sulfidaeris TaxID=115553 RepID=A0A455UAJ4_9GAMM|nr:hypothetical protein HSBAA_44980 [Halomonas sulfidaeris]